MKDNIIEFFYPEKTKQLVDDVFPEPALKHVPKWYKELKHSKEIPTIKGCMPFLDSLTAGYIMKMPQDLCLEHNIINIKGKKDSAFRYSYRDSPEIRTRFRLNINAERHEIHPVEQLGPKCPFHKKNKDLPFYKILNPFAIKTPPGYSCLFVPPLNNHDDRFEIVSGIVDTDTYEGEINFPIIINGDKYPILETVIKRGTPIAQVIPFKRESWKMMIKERSLTKTLMGFFQVKKFLVNNYMRLFWKKKKWN
tara:strand:+ start:304 stop:1056 length:753 start_codon:yes stop_codon:yes gene_type:complete